jgi:quercetin dioxygenase-like cupin family protein
MHVPPPFDAFLDAAADVLDASGHPRTDLFSDHLRGRGELSTGTPPGNMRFADGFVAALSDQAVADNAATLKRELQKVWPHFCWRSADALETPEPFRSGHSFVELLGPKGHYPTPNLRFGLFVIAPNTPYPSHVHEAEEFYYILSGTADWQQDTDGYAPVPPGTIIHNAPFRPHGMTTHDEMLITLWGWRGDIRFDQYRFV